MFPESPKLTARHRNSHDKIIPLQRGELKNDSIPVKPHIENIRQDKSGTSLTSEDEPSKPSKMKRIIKPRIFGESDGKQNVFGFNNKSGILTMTKLRH
jgi:hypothetical protein